MVCAILIVGFPNSGKSSVIRSLTGANFGFKSKDLNAIYKLDSSKGRRIRVYSIHTGAREYGLCPKCYGVQVKGVMDNEGFDVFVNAIDVMKRYSKRKCGSCGKFFVGHPCDYINELKNIGIDMIKVVGIDANRNSRKYVFKDISDCIDVSNSSIVTFIGSASYLDPFIVAKKIREKFTDCF